MYAVYVHKFVQLLLLLSTDKRNTGSDFVSNPRTCTTNSEGRLICVYCYFI